MRSFLEELLAALPADGACESTEDFAKPYPSLVIAQLMGAPLEDAPALYRWSNWIQRQFDPLSLTTEREGDRAARSGIHYCVGATGWRRCLCS